MTPESNLESLRAGGWETKLDGWRLAREWCFFFVCNERWMRFGLVMVNGN